MEKEKQELGARTNELSAELNETPIDDRRQAVGVVMQQLGEKEEVHDTDDRWEDIYKVTVDQLAPWIAKGMPCSSPGLAHGMVPYDVIPSSINQGLGSDGNFFKAASEMVMLSFLARDKDKVRALVADPQFVLGIKQILRDMYLLKMVLEEGEGYKQYVDGRWSSPDGPIAMPEVQAEACKRGVFVADRVIEILEFFLMAANDESAEYQSVLIPACEGVSYNSAVDTVQEGTRKNIYVGYGYGNPVEPPRRKTPKRSKKGTTRKKKR